MSLNRILSFSLIALVVGCATADQVKQLDERVATLEKAIEEGAGSGKAKKRNDASEKAAKLLLDKITKAVKANKTDEAKATLGELKAKYASTTAYKRARKFEGELAVVGKVAPTSLEVEKWLANEAAIDMASESPTLLVFWEQWCPHCRSEVPKVQKWYEDYSGLGLQVVGLTKISKSATPEIVDTFIKENKLTYPMAKEDSSVSKYFNVRGIPAAAMVKGGKIVWRGHPGRLTEDMIKGWL